MDKTDIVEVLEKEGLLTIFKKICDKKSSCILTLKIVYNEGGMRSIIENIEHKIK